VALSPNSILAGPLLRRAEPSRVCIWIATNTDVTITGEIFAADTVLTGEYTQLGRGDDSSLQFGKELFVTLVSIEPLERKGVPQSKLFPTDQLLAYDLMIRERDRPYASGKRLPVLFPNIEDPQSGIAYRGLKLPTLNLASLAVPLNILHGSCRKFHGEQGDALVFADQIIAKNLGIPLKQGQPSNLDGRPSALVLTGDQIYADDVATPLVDHLLSMSHTLLGWDEIMPPRDHGGYPIPRAALGSPADQLKGIFTSQAMQNQLVSFGDFASMYLMSYGPALWPLKWPTKSAAPGIPGRNYYPNISDADWRGQIANLDRYKQTLPAARRVFANIPTYMVFDDHEVTDDWNLYEQFVTHVNNSPLARRVVANALAAYWLFQAWGDDPDVFKGLAGPIVRSLTSPNRTGSFENSMLGHGSWAFVAPTAPPIVLIDSRTQRGFDPDPRAKRGESKNPPRLMNANEAAHFTRLAAQAISSSPEGLLIIVAATPPFGVEAFEKFQKFLSKIKGPEQLDFEAWRANPGGWTDLLAATAAARPRSLIVLSGDVHYSFATRIGLRIKDQPQSIAGLQFTSSSLKNAIVAGSRTALLIGQWTNFPDQQFDIWQKPVHARSLQSADPTGGGSNESAGAVLNILQQAPIIVDPGFTRRVQIVEPPDFQLVLRLMPASDTQEAMILFDSGLGQLISDGRTATAIFHVADRPGSSRDKPRIMKIDLTTPPSPSRVRPSRNLP
jgi:hypothetical protein